MLKNNFSASLSIYAPGIPEKFEMATGFSGPSHRAFHCCSYDSGEPGLLGSMLHNDFLAFAQFTVSTVGHSEQIKSECQTLHWGPSHPSLNFLFKLEININVNVQTLLIENT